MLPRYFTTYTRSFCQNTTAPHQVLEMSEQHSKRDTNPWNCLPPVVEDFLPSFLGCQSFARLKQTQTELSSEKGTELSSRRQLRTAVQLSKRALKKNCTNSHKKTAVGAIFSTPPCWARGQWKKKKKSTPPAVSQDWLHGELEPAVAEVQSFAKKSFSGAPAAVAQSFWCSFYFDAVSSDNISSLLSSPNHAHPGFSYCIIKNLFPTLSGERKKKSVLPQATLMDRYSVSPWPATTFQCSAPAMESFQRRNCSKPCLV